MKLFLDDYRVPMDCIVHMYDRIGLLNSVYRDDKWVVLRNYPDFVRAINKYKGAVTHISFDHDLADGHYNQNMQEGTINYDSEDFSGNDFNKTGYHAALYLKKVYVEHQLALPIILVHTMNSVGRKNIEEVFEPTKELK